MTKPRNADGDLPRSPASLLPHPLVSLPLRIYIYLPPHRRNRGDREAEERGERELIRESWKAVIAIRCFEILKSLFFSGNIFVCVLFFSFSDISIPFLSLFLFMNQGFVALFSVNSIKTCSFFSLVGWFGLVIPCDYFLWIRLVFFLHLSEKLFLLGFCIKILGRRLFFWLFFSLIL